MVKKALSIAVMLLVAVLLFVNMSKLSSDTSESDKHKVVDTEILIKLEKDASAVEESIREIIEKRLEALKVDPVKETLEKLDSGEISLRQIFSDTFIAGDSLMNGLEIYGILNEDKLATQVSASLYHLSDNVSSIVAANPRNVILHYGINMISTDESQRESFIEQYRELVLEIKSSLPNARIIISGLFPVDTASATEARFTMVSAYNKALSKMCEDTGVEFLDSTKAFEGNSDYYAYDGIHVSSGFYANVWLPYIIETKGITG